MSLVQLGQSLMVGGLMTAGAWWVLRNPRYGRSRWLGWAFLAQGLLFLHYVPVLARRVGMGEAEQQAAITAFEELGTYYLKPVFDKLNGTLNYDELKILRMLYLISKQDNK